MNVPLTGREAEQIAQKNWAMARVSSQAARQTAVEASRAKAAKIDSIAKRFNLTEDGLEETSGSTPRKKTQKQQFLVRRPNIRKQSLRGKRVANKPRLKGYYSTRKSFNLN